MIPNEKSIKERKDHLKEGIVATDEFINMEFSIEDKEIKEMKDLINLKE